MRAKYLKAKNLVARGNFLVKGQKMHIKVYKRNNHSGYVATVSKTDRRDMMKEIRAMREKAKSKRKRKKK